MRLNRVAVRSFLAGADGETLIDGSLVGLDTKLEPRCTLRGEAVSARSRVCRVHGSGAHAGDRYSHRDVHDQLWRAAEAASLRGGLATL